MAERINQHRNPVVGTNIRRLRKERKMKAVDVIAQLQLKGVNVTTGIFSKGLFQTVNMIKRKKI